jgi:hypothetical protein
VTQDPSKLPQVVFLTLSSFEADQNREVQVHFVRPREMKQANVFRIIIHLEVEDLMFYHYPREELLADGKIPWREFPWRFRCPDGELQEEDDPVLPPRSCSRDFTRSWCREMTTTTEIT